MHQPKISIIVPVYNVELYLARCLDSLINQTLKDIEIICIDDCSTDSSLAILKKYAKKDIRIKLIEAKTNRGLGLTRNTGLKIANGDYVSFVDSDDWLDLDCLQVCYDNLITNDLDVIYFGARYVQPDYTNGVVCGIKEENSIVLDSSSVFDFYIENLGKFLMMVVWNKVYKRSFLQSYQLEFFDIFYEDNDYSFRVHYYAKKYMLIPHVFYNYYQRHGSIANSLSTKHANDAVQGVLNMKDFLISKNKWNDYAELFFRNIVRAQLESFPSRIIGLCDNNLEKILTIKNLWVARLNEYSIISEMINYLSANELYQMFNVFNIVKHRDYLSTRCDDLVKHRDAILKQKEYYKIYTDSRYEKLYYSEWASFGRLSKVAKVLYLVKKMIKFPFKLILRVMKR